MHIVTLDSEGCLVLPEDLRQRYGLDSGEDFLLGKTESGLALYPLRPDVRKVYLEPTTRCNLHCRTCVRNVWEEPPEDMSAATFERFLAGLRDLPRLRQVVFGGYGEPLAHPRILDYVGAVKDLGVKITISTNGTLLDEERARALVDLGLDGITVSLDGTDGAAYSSPNGEGQAGHGSIVPAARRLDGGDTDMKRKTTSHQNTVQSTGQGVWSQLPLRQIGIVAGVMILIGTVLFLKARQSPAAPVAQGTAAPTAACRSRWWNTNRPF